MTKQKLRKCNLKKFCKNCGEVEIEEDEKGVFRCPTCSNKLYTVVNKEKK